jgi:hypothetical protein
MDDLRDTRLGYSKILHYGFGASHDSLVSYFGDERSAPAQATLI